MGVPGSSDTRTRLVGRQPLRRPPIRSSFAPCAAPALSVRPGKQCPPPTDLYRPSWPPSAASTCLLHADTRSTEQQMKKKKATQRCAPNRLAQPSSIALESTTCAEWAHSLLHRAVADSTPAAAVRVRMRRATCGGEKRRPAGRSSTAEMAGPSILRCAVLPRASYRAVDCLLPPTCRRGGARWMERSAGGAPPAVHPAASGSEHCTPARAHATSMCGSVFRTHLVCRTCR